MVKFPNTKSQPQSFLLFAKFEPQCFLISVFRLLNSPNIVNYNLKYSVSQENVHIIKLNICIFNGDVDEHVEFL